jgi:hypothetical protein
MAPRGKKSVKIFPAGGVSNPITNYFGKLVSVVGDEAIPYSRLRDNEGRVRGVSLDLAS